MPAIVKTIPVDCTGTCHLDLSHPKAAAHQPYSRHSFHRQGGACLLAESEHHSNREQEPPHAHLEYHLSPREVRHETLGWEAEIETSHVSIVLRRWVPVRQSLRRCGARVRELGGKGVK